MMRTILTAVAALLLAVPVVSASAQPATATASADFAAQLALLQGRVDALERQVSVGSGQYPIATTPGGQLISAGGNDWASGFWAATLWRLFDLTGSEHDRSRALSATVDHFGFEGTRLHDLGFMYGETSMAGFVRHCAGAAGGSQCGALRRSARAAARTLYALAATTGQKIIPMSTRDCSDCGRAQTETIVDSMMNLELLTWAARDMRQTRYRKLARRHADWVAKHLQRKDGSTYQAGKYLRSARGKRVRVVRHTHQGLSNTSVWARGQAWSIYGFAKAGREFRSAKFLAVAERNARYVERRLPVDGVPPWDFRAGAAAVRDVSAGVITAAGLFHLAAACKTVKKACKHGSRWAPLARRVLGGSLSGIATSGALPGFLGGQVYRYRYKSGRRWERSAELVLGINYALEAVALARQAS